MNPKVLKFVLFMWIFGLGLVISLPLRAQVAGGTLSGTISDESGGTIPQAQIVIKNVETGVIRTVTTNADGFYTAVNILPGIYQVTIFAKGFNTEIKKGITINVGSQPVFNLVLQISSVSNRVEVTTEAPTIQLASSDISATVNATTVRELPLNGRSWTDLAALQPGVETIQTQPSFATGSDRGNRGFGQQLTISGARPQQNNYRLDGISLNDYCQWGARQCSRRKSGRRRHSRVLRPHEQLFGGVRQDLRRSSQRHYALGNQCVSRERIRVPTEQRSGRGKFF